VRHAIHSSELDPRKTNHARSRIVASARGTGAVTETMAMIPSHTPTAAPSSQRASDPEGRAAREDSLVMLEDDSDPDVQEIERTLCVRVGLCGRRLGSLPHIRRRSFGFGFARRGCFMSGFAGTPHLEG
jgi:hypothetical protein